MPNFCAEALGIGARRHVRPDADDDAGHVARCPTIAWIIARSSNELYMSARTPRNIGAEDREARSPASRSAVGTRIAFGRHRARAVVGVVVAEAEEEEEVVARALRVATCAMSAGLVGPSLSSQRELVGDRVRLRRRRARDRAAEVARDRARATTGKRRTAHAVDLSRRRPATRCATSRSRGRTWSAPRPRGAAPGARRRSGRAARRRR